MAEISTVHFLRPEWLVLIPLWGALLFFVRKSVFLRRNAWAQICAPALLRYLVGERAEESAANTGVIPSQKNRLWAVAALMFAGLCLGVALAGPVWVSMPQPVFKTQTGKVIVLDLSRSMDAQDVRPSRLQRAKQKLQDILRLAPEGQTGLIVFAGSTFDVIPLTTDSHAILAVLDSLDTAMMPKQGSRASLGLEAALAMLKRGTLTNGTVVLITDGVDNAAVNGAEALAKAGHRVQVLGVGTAQGAPIPLAGKEGKDKKTGFLQDASGNIIIPRLQASALRAVANAGHGSYQAQRWNDLDIRALLPLNNATHHAKGDKATSEMQDNAVTVQWQEEGPWFILLALPFLVLVFRRGVLSLVLVVAVSGVLLPPQSVQAAQAEPLGSGLNRFSDWWLTADQQGQRRMQANQPQAAAALFQDPEHKAAALYRAGDYAAAAETLQGIQNAEALYNRGNALAKSGQLAEAKQAYDEALKLNPKHEDALFNREAVVQAMQKDSKDNPNEKPDEKPSKDGEGQQGSQTEEGQEGEGQSQSDKNQSANPSGEQGQSGQPQQGDDSSESSTAGEAPQGQTNRVDSDSSPHSNSSPDTDSDSEKTAFGQDDQNDEPNSDAKEQALSAYKKALQEDAKEDNQSSMMTQQANEAAEKPETSEETSLSAEEGQASSDEPMKSEDTPVFSPADQSPFDSATQEKMQAQQQRLRRIPDDPGGLLRRKFLYQYQRQAAQASKQEGQPW